MFYFSLDMIEQPFRVVEQGNYRAILHSITL